MDLSVLARECDIITFHTPLNRNGKYKTFHLADADFFVGLQRKPFIVNTSRGEVMETLALLDALKTGRIRDAVIDTWENEPDIHPDLLQKVFLGTPHIAGIQLTESRMLHGWHWRSFVTSSIYRLILK